MKQTIYGLVLLVLCLACTRDIGSRPFDLDQAKEFSFFIPGTGTFKFTQRFRLTPKITDVTTYLKIVDNEKEMKSIFFEIYVFEDSIKAFDNLDFEIRDTLGTGAQDSLKISSIGSVLITEDNLIVRVLDEKNTSSAHYEGQATFSQEDGTQEPELFNVFGNIDAQGRLFLLSIEPTASITLLTGTYFEPDEFFGEARSREAVLGTVAAEDTMDAMDSGSNLELNFIVTTNGVERKLKLNLNKTTNEN